jgi:hypothetical protein
VLDNDNSIRLRIEDSRRIEAKAQASYIILRYAIKWRNKRELAKRIEKIISKPTHHDDDYDRIDIIEDKYGYN